MNFITKAYDKPDNRLVEKIGKIPTPALSDVMGRRNCMDSRIKPLYKNARVVGPALTIRSYPSDNLMIHVGLKMAQKGDVLVVDAGGYLNAGLWGELMTIMAKCKNVKGLIIDGAVRDCFEIEELGFPVFCAGISARGGFKSDPGSINCTISCGGVVVNAGDIILADENGVIVVPQNSASQIYEKALAKVKKEKEIVDMIKKGHELFDILNLDKELERIDIRIV